MTLFVNLMRRLVMWPFRRRGLLAIANIGHQAFASVLAWLEQMGWKVYARYGGFDAGIDYDCIRLKRAGIKLKCEWDPCDEWRIEGPVEVIEAIASQFDLVATSE